MQKSRTLLAAFLTSAIVAPAMAGTWKYEVDPRDHSVLTYEQDGKATFLLGCGHVFALHVKYPGQARKKGNATISIASSNKSMTFKGSFEEPDDESVTTFEQFDLGYRRQDPELYGKTWKVQRDRLLDLLDSGKPLTISAGKASYTLPPVDAKDWHKALGGCG